MMQGIVWMLGTLMEVVLLLSLQRGTNRSLRTSRSDPPPGSGGCFNCGIDGHQARDCKPGDWKNKCYRCEERDHIEQNWKNSPRKLKSPARKEQSFEHGDRLQSPEPKNSPPLYKVRKRSPTPGGGSSLHKRGRASPQNGKLTAHEGKASYGGSPRGVSRSPASPDRDASPVRRQYQSPSDAQCWQLKSQSKIL